MKLRRLTLTSYRSVKKEEVLLTDEKVTILIGANDHGKSNLLSAIQCLNDDQAITEEDKNWDASPAAPEGRRGVPRRAASG